MVVRRVRHGFVVGAGLALVVLHNAFDGITYTKGSAIIAITVNRNGKRLSASPPTGSNRR